MKLRPLILCLCAAATALSSVQGGLPSGWKPFNPKPGATPKVGATPLPKNFGEEYVAKDLYTEPDPSSSGGIRLTALVPLKNAFAIPQNNQYHIYKGKISGGQVSFDGLPTAKYDLMLQADDHVYEGIVLNRDEDNLNEHDLKFIQITVKQNIPFFDLKHIHRIKGTTGKSGKAVALTQEVRTGRTGLILNQNADTLVGFQIRSIKLQFIEDVGVAGWQVLQTREIIRQSVHPEMKPKDLMPITFSEKISNIRITDSVKDLGPVALP